MKILLANLGTYGDILPFLAVGRELVRRGHDVHLFAPAPFEAQALRAGLAFHPLGTRKEFDLVMETPLFTRPLASLRFGLDIGMTAAERTFDWIAGHWREDRDLVLVASPFAYGARIAQDLFRLPAATLHLAPFLVESALRAPRLPGMPGPEILPRRYRHRLGRGADRYLLDPIALPPLNAFRARFGLAPVRRLRHWWNSPDRMILLFPPWYVPPADDWPAQARQVDFLLADRLGETREAALDPALAAFLAAGSAAERPLAFTFGSEMRNTRAFFATAAAICRRMGRRGVLVAPRPDLVPDALPPEILRVGYVPFSALLPACAALIHHGGIGTVAQALAAGVPQLVVPSMSNQFDEGEHVARLGVGASLSVRAFTAARAARVLERLLAAPEVAVACAGARARMAGADGVAAACDAIERLVPAGGT